MKGGFTLIELLVAVVIVGVVTSGGLLIFSQQQARSEVQKGTQEIAQLVRSAQSSAKSRELKGGATQFRYIVIGNSSGKITASTDGGQVYDQKNYSSEGLTVSLSPGPIYFLAGSGKVAVNSSGAPLAFGSLMSISVRNTALSLGTTITVDALGQVQIK